MGLLCQPCLAHWERRGSHLHGRSVGSCVLIVLTVLEKTRACSEPFTQSQCELLWMVLHGCSVPHCTVVERAF